MRPRLVSALLLAVPLLIFLDCSASPTTVKPRPTPTTTPAATATSALVPTQRPTATVEPAPTPAPSRTPDTTPSPTPTPTPLPTPTRTPAATPSPTTLPTPTASPVPTPVAAQDVRIDCVPTGTRTRTSTGGHCTTRTTRGSCSCFPSTFWRLGRPSVCTPMRCMKSGAGSASRKAQPSGTTRMPIRRYSRMPLAG